jgi:hypothetical protein
MANPAESGGFQPVANLKGRPGHVSRYCALAAYGTAVGKGDLAIIMGTVGAPTDYGSAKSVAAIQQAAAGDVTNGATLNGVPASVLRSVFVEEDPKTIYLASVDGAAAAIPVEASQLTAEWVVAAASAATLLSNYQIDGTTEAAADGTLGLRLLRPSPFTGDTDTLATPRWLCLINRSRYVNQVAGV